MKHWTRIITGISVLAALTGVGVVVAVAVAFVVHAPRFAAAVAGFFIVVYLLGLLAELGGIE